MNDRDIIIAALRTAEGESADNFTPAYYQEYADAVLAAIGDRLLPPLPEWCSTVHICMDHKDAAFDSIGSGKTYIEAHADCIADAEPALRDMIEHPEDYE